MASLALWATDWGDAHACDGGVYDYVYDSVCVIFIEIRVEISLDFCLKIFF